MVRNIQSNKSVMPASAVIIWATNEPAIALSFVPLGTNVSSNPAGKSKKVSISACGKPGPVCRRGSCPPWLDAEISIPDVHVASLVQPLKSPDSKPPLATTGGNGQVCTPRRRVFGYVPGMRRRQTPERIVAVAVGVRRKFPIVVAAVAVLIDKDMHTLDGGSSRCRTPSGSRSSHLVP